MTNEEARNIIEKMCFKVAVNSPAQDALVMANMALQNQTKYEKALQLASDFIHSQDICPVENCKFCGPNDEGGDQECYGDGCNANLADYFKRKAGLDV